MYYTESLLVSTEDDSVRHHSTIHADPVTIMCQSDINQAEIWCQSDVNRLPIQCQSSQSNDDPFQIWCQSNINLISVNQSSDKLTTLENLPIHHQSTDPIVILGQSANDGDRISIHLQFSNLMSILYQSPTHHIGQPTNWLDPYVNLPPIQMWQSHIPSPCMFLPIYCQSTNPPQ